MTVTVRLPDELATHLAATGGADLERRVLEAVVLEEFRSGRMSKAALRRALGFEVLDEVDCFLKAHAVWEYISLDDVRSDVETLERLGF
jgi:hypothetical protein